jgi:hypothetical protein
MPILNVVYKIFSVFSGKFSDSNVHSFEGTRTSHSLA